MKVLLLGSGGRESALAAGLARSPSVADLTVAPGNPGIAEFAATVDVDVIDATAVADLAGRLGTDLVVIGPEAPLVAGVGDLLRERGTAVFGPSAAAARIEGSKSWAKELMAEAGVPSGASGSFSDRDAAVSYLEGLAPPFVVKADGLAAGKGVVVTDDLGEAVEAVDDRLVRGVFGEAGRSVLIEEYLEGPEVSLIAFTDGSAVVPCQPARDYKRLQDGDAGPNTGGMGSYSPVEDCPSALAQQVVEEILQPMVRILEQRETPFSGALYAGLALTSSGPRVIEFNARFGDPETQALIPRLRSDLGELCMASATRQLAGMEAAWSAEVCTTIVLASAGYPGRPSTGKVIDGLSDAARVPGVSIFHAGTERVRGSIVTSGGRVLAVSALGDDFTRARSTAYEAAGYIRFEGMQMRTDIGAGAVQQDSSALASGGETV